MKKLVLMSILLLDSLSAQAKQDNNIVSLLIGQGPSGINQNPGSSATTTNSSTTTSCTSPGHSNCNGHSGSTTNITTVNNNTINNSSAISQNKGVVSGVMYQRRIEDSPLLMGILIQSNETYSLIMGLSF